MFEVEVEQRVLLIPVPFICNTQPHVSRLLCHFLSACDVSLRLATTTVQNAWCAWLVGKGILKCMNGHMRQVYTVLANPDIRRSCTQYNPLFLLGSASHTGQQTDLTRMHVHTCKNMHVHTLTHTYTYSLKLRARSLSASVASWAWMFLQAPSGF